MKCRHCGSPDHDHEEMNEVCVANLQAVAGILGANKDAPGQMNLPGLPETEPVVGPTDPIATRVTVTPYLLKDVAWGESFVLVADLARNPLNPPVYVKGTSIGRGVECIDLRRCTRSNMPVGTKVARIRINSIVFEYVDVLEIEGVAKVVKSGDDMPTDPPIPGRFAGEEG